MTTAIPNYAVHGNALRRFFSKATAMLMAAFSPEAKERQRQENAFRQTIAKYADTISGICFSLAKTSAEYEDLRQDAVINIWRGIGKFRGEAETRTWIYRVVMNSCVSVYRKQLRNPVRDAIAEIPEIADTDGDTREDITWLHHLISQLPDTDRCIIIMWLDEQSYDEIAAVTGLNRNTVATRLRRIRLKLAEQAKKII